MWLNKERMVFVVMAIFLCFRVYKVLYPPKPEGLSTVFQSPTSTGKIGVETPDPRAPALPPPPATPPLTRSNPFWYYAAPSTGSGSEEEGSTHLKLIGIQKTPKGPLARISSKGERARAYHEGEEFENYMVQKIDVDAGTVTVYDESAGKPVVLKEKRR